MPLIIFQKFLIRLEQLEKLEVIFNAPHNEDDWLSKSIRILKDVSLQLDQINHFFEYLDRNLSNVNENCWNLIKDYYVIVQ